MEVEFISEAEKDLLEACSYYEAKERGLGVRFRNEIFKILATVASSPYLWRERSSGYRRVNFPVFPYYIAYVIREEVIVVIAVAASRREPGYWHHRVD